MHLATAWHHDNKHHMPKPLDTTSGFEEVAWVVIPKVMVASRGEVHFLDEVYGNEAAVESIRVMNDAAALMVDSRSQSGNRLWAVWLLVALLYFATIGCGWFYAGFGLIEGLVSTIALVISLLVATIYWRRAPLSAPIAYCD
jgi:hypothetical protein